MKNVFRKKYQRILSYILAAILVITAMPMQSVIAEEKIEKYPYTIFAASEEEGAITVHAGNFCVNGNIATNGTILSDGNRNINGKETERAGEEMISISRKLVHTYFSSENVESYETDYIYEDTNIHLTAPMSVDGCLELRGNVTMHASVMACEDIALRGEVKNISNSVIYSKSGDIFIEGNNVNLTGLLYAPEGSIVLSAQNMNLNRVILIAEKIVFDCPNVNVNYDEQMAEFIGNTSDEAEEGTQDGGDATGGDITGGDVTDGDVSEGDTESVVTELYAVGDYDPDTHSILIRWYSNGVCDKYQIECSDDGKIYSIMTQVADKTSYLYPLETDLEKQYFRVAAVDAQVEVARSIPFWVRKTESGYEVLYLDSDGEGLEDVFELVLGTDSQVPDSDKDGLTDYQEVCLLQTDPNRYDSLCSGIADAKADWDGDGFTSLQELAYGTDLRKYDSDNDTLSDAEEVEHYQTNPLEWDSDKDSLCDSEEFLLGLDPQNPQTYGVPDAAYQVRQHVSVDSEVFREINTQTSPYKLSVDITATGYVEGNLDVRQSTYSAVIQNNAMLGVAAEFIYPKGQVSGVTLRFEIDESFIEAGADLFPDEDELRGIKRFQVFRFFEEEGALLPIATEFDVENNCILAKTEELGTYCVLDMELWLEGFTVPTEVYQASAPMLMSVEGEVTEEQLIAQARPIEAVFILQSAGINKSDYEAQKNRILHLFESLTARYGARVKFCVILFDLSSGQILTTDTGSVWFTDLTALTKKFSAVKYVTTSEYTDRGPAFSKLKLKVPFSEGAEKFVYLSTNGFGYIGENEVPVISNLIAKGGHYSEVLPYGAHYYDSSYAKELARLIEKSEGLNIKFTSATEQIMFEHMCHHAEKKADEMGEMGVIVPTGWKNIVLDGPISIGDSPNSDTDGLSDWDEIQIRKLKWDEKGNPILPTINEAYGAYAMDGFARFKSEQWAAGMPSTDFEKYFDYVLSHTQILPIKSDPTEPDSDCDGLDDEEEKNLRTDVFSIDTDGDSVDDEEEHFMGLDPLEDDTDGDGLRDGYELVLLFDPTSANADGDEYSDYEEYRRGSNPYVAEKEVEVQDSTARFWKGVMFGDFVKDDEVDGHVLMGQIAGGFVPIIADGRDVIANLSKGDLLMSLLSAAGFFPGAGDAAKVVGELGGAIRRLGDDVGTATNLLLEVGAKHPNLIKYFGHSDEVAEAIRRAAVSPDITGESLELILKYADEAGIALARSSDVFKHTDNVIETGMNAWTLGWSKRGKILDEAANHHSLGKGLGEFFPGADRLDNIDGVDTLVSTKSVDLSAKTYRDPKGLDNRIKSYVNKFDRFEQDYPKVKTDGIPYSDSDNLTIKDYKRKKIELIIPDIPLSAGQQEVLQKYIDSGQIFVRIARG